MRETMGAIEKQVFRTYWNDGLLDLFGAIAVLAIGVCWTYDLIVGAAIVPAVMVPLWVPIRRRFIEPRLGMVEFSDARDRHNAGRLKMVAALGVGTFFLAVVLYFLRDRLGVSPAVTVVAGLPAMLLGLLATLTAFMISAFRYLAYAAVLVIAGISGALAGFEPGPIMSAAGVSLLLVAFVVVIRFVRENPVSGEYE